MTSLLATWQEEGNEKLFLPVRQVNVGVNVVERGNRKAGMFYIYCAFNRHFR